MADTPGRDLDILKQSHRIAQDRRAKGLNPWAKSIPLSTLIQDNQDSRDPTFLIEKCHRIAAMVKPVVKPEHLDFANAEEYNEQLSDALEMLEYASAIDFENVDDGLTEMNYALGAIYDYCDIERIWTRK